MTYCLTIGLFTEGTTDERFLMPVIEKTIGEITFNECVGQIDYELQIVEIDKTGLSFTEQVLAASEKGMTDFGMMILCVHADADSAGNTYETRIEPAKTELEKQDQNDFCRILVAVVPNHTVEAWMLADTDLLKQKIPSDKSDVDLKINRQPESIANPKSVIEEAIRIARAGKTRKRRKEVSISDLYLPIGESIDLKKLEKLNSFNDFKENVRSALRELNLLH